MVRSSSFPPSGRSSASSFVQVNPTGFLVGSSGTGTAGCVASHASTNNTTAGSFPPAGMAGVSFAKPFGQPTAQPAAANKVQSPFMYSGFGASASGMKPAYIGFGAQAPHTTQAKGVRPAVVNVNVGSIPRAGGSYNGELWTGRSTVHPTSRCTQLLPSEGPPRAP